MGRREMREFVAMPNKSGQEEIRNVTRDRIPSTLSFLSIKTDAQPYPDTGESGETYDAEAFALAVRNPRPYTASGFQTR
jgi:hypothetical protein